MAASMKICVPIAEDRGLLSPVSPHFGHAPSFLIVDTATLAFRSVPNPLRTEGPRCDLQRALSEHRVEAYVVVGIGAKAVAGIAARGVPIYRAARGRVADALAELVAGNLPTVSGASDGPGWSNG